MTPPLPLSPIISGASGSRHHFLPVEPKVGIGATTDSTSLTTTRASLADSADGEKRREVERDRFGAPSPSS